MVNSSIGIVVHIAEATGLYQRNDDRAMITASLGGKTIETEPAITRNTTHFGNNLVWETDRKSMKRMKSENLPIKLECFSVNKNGNRELIGFFIILMRSIPDKAASKTRWHKLIGVSSTWKTKKPEILVGITITDMKNINQLTFSQSGSDLNRTLSTSSINNMLQSQNGLFIKLYENERYIQIGDAPNDCNIFIVEILFKSFSNLNQLYGDSMNFYIQYSLFGALSDKRLLKRVLNDEDTNNNNNNVDLHTIREKIVIRFRSSIQLLRIYFEKIFTIPIEIFANDHYPPVVGVLSLNLADVMFDDCDLNEFIDKYSSLDNTHTAHGQCNIRSDINGQLTDINESFMDYEFHLKCEQNEPLLKSARSPLNTPLRFDIGDGDESSIKSLRNSCAAIENLSPSTNSLRNPIEPLTLLQENNPDTVEPMNSSQSNVSVNSSAKDNGPELTRTYSYKLFIENIKFTKKPTNGIWQISFYHPNAHTKLAVINVDVKDAIDKEKIVIETYFSSESKQIDELIGSEPGVIRVKGPKNTFATAELNNMALLAQKSNPGIILMENEYGEKTAMASAYVSLNDIGTNFNCQQNNFILPTPSMLYHQNANKSPSQCYAVNDELAYKAVEELEQWKIEQQAQFSVDLKEREEKYLQQLGREWQRQRNDDETKLNDVMGRFNMLTEALDEANQALKERHIKEIDRERIFMKAKSDMEQTYSAKLLSLYERVQRFEADSEHRLNVAEQKNQKISEENQRLSQYVVELETKTGCNEDAQQKLTDLQHELDIRNERIDHLIKSKQFYKEQWAIMIREWNKNENNGPFPFDSDNRQTQSSYSQLNDFSSDNCMRLSEVLNEERNALYTDRKELESVRNCLI